MKHYRSILIHGIINALLPVLVVLAHQGVFGAPENPWKWFWLGITMAIVPVVSSIVGMIIAAVRLKRASAPTVKVGLILSCVGLIMHIIFRFVLKI